MNERNGSERIGIKTFLGFISVVLVFLFLANFIVYEAAILVFGSSFSILLIFILTVCGASFIASIFLGMRYYNWFTRAYAVLSMTWMGFFAYYFIASVLYVLELSLFGGSSKVVAFILFGGAVIVGVYGLVHAWKLVVKNVEVEIIDLPDIWRKRKVVWISDLHVGQIHGAGFVKRVIEKLKIIAPDILFIGGDLFDGSAPQGILDSIEPFRELVIPLGKYFVTGNHEGYGNEKAFLDKISDTGILILNNKKIVVDNLQIIGVDYKDTAREKDLKNVFNNLVIKKEIPSILLKHEPRFIEIAEQAGISFQISGHTHKAQQWPFEYLARLAYGRFTYGLNRFGNIQVFTSSGTGTWGPPMRVGTDCEIVVFSLK